MNFPKKHFMALVVSYLLWGFSFPALKIALRTNSPLSVTFYRYGIAFLLVLPFSGRRYFNRSMFCAPHARLLLLGVFNWAGSILQFTGLTMTTAVNSAMLTQIIVVVVPLMSIWLLGERLNWRKVLAIFFSLFGAVMLSTNLEFRNLMKGATHAGDGLTVAAVLFWSLFIIYTRKFVMQAPAFHLLMANYTATFLLSAVTASASGRLAIDRTGIFMSLFLALFCTILPMVLYNYGMREVEATSSAIIGPLETVSAVLLAFFILHERLSTVGMAGSILIILSVYLVGLPGKRKWGKSLA